MLFNLLQGGMHVAQRILTLRGQFLLDLPPLVVQPLAIEPQLVAADVERQPLGMPTTHKLGNGGETAVQEFVVGVVFIRRCKRVGIVDLEQPINSPVERALPLVHFLVAVAQFLALVVEPQASLPHVVVELGKLLRQLRFAALDIFFASAQLGGDLFRLLVEQNKVDRRCLRCWQIE